MKKILLIGGSSDLGKELAFQLTDIEFTNFDITNTNNFVNKYIEGNLLNPHSFDFEDYYDAVIHIAGIHPLIEKEENPQLMTRVNVEGVQNILTKLKTSKTRNFIYISSSSATKRKNLYGMTKYLGEQIVDLFSKKEGFNAYSLRTRGFTPFYSMSYNNYIDFANWFLSGAVHIQDVVNTVKHCINKPNQKSHKILLVDGKSDYTEQELSNWKKEIFIEKYKKDFNEEISLLNIVKPSYTLDHNNIISPSIGISEVLKDLKEYNRRINKINELKSLVKKFHKNTYGENPFIYHIEKVLLNLKKFGYGNILNDRIFKMMQAAILHDIIEDTEMTLEKLKEYVTTDVIDLVWRLTDEEGETRQEQKLATYPKIAEKNDAIIIKLADRISNTEEGIRLNTKRDRSFLKRYKREYPLFKEKLSNGKNLAMWSLLDQYSL